jgi:hypothetical protein
VRVSLGASSFLDQPSTGPPLVVGTDLVLRNAARRPVTLIGFEVTGPGASLVTDSPGGPSTELPQALPPAQERRNRIGLGSDCSVLIRPAPTVTLVLRRFDGVTVRQQAYIPDMETLWGQTLDPGLCAQFG